MRSDKTIILINAEPWLIDFRRNRFTRLPKNIHRVITNLENLFSFFDGESAFHVWRRSIRYKDYADAETVMKEDAANNKSKHKNGQQPTLELTEKFKGAVEKKLTNSCDPILSACDILLKHSMSSLGTHSFHTDTIQLRPSPSVGARHGIDVFVHMKDGVYYYSGSRHSLLHIDDRNRVDADLAMTFFCRADAYIWRYPQGSCLLDVYLDFGHILGNISLSAKSIDLERPILLSHPVEKEYFPIGSITLGTVCFQLSQA